MEGKNKNLIDQVLNDACALSYLLPHPSPLTIRADVIHERCASMLADL
jgi:hypothetical protein